MKPLLIALALAALPALAQTEVRRAQVYRCGLDGRDLRDSPCPGSAAASSASVAYDQPSGADSHAAREHHLAEAKRADALASARRASEAEARHRRAQSVGLQVPPQAQAASSPPLPPPPRRPHVARPAKAPRPAASFPGR